MKKLITQTEVQRVQFKAKCTLLCLECCFQSVKKKSAVIVLRCSTFLQKGSSGINLKPPSQVQYIGLADVKGMQGNYTHANKKRK